MKYFYLKKQYDQYLNTKNAARPSKRFFYFLNNFRLVGKDFGATAKSVTKTCNLANLAYLATQTANDTNADAL